MGRKDGAGKCRHNVLHNFVSGWLDEQPYPPIHYRILYGRYAANILIIIIIKEYYYSTGSRKKLQEHFTTEKNKTNDSVTRVKNRSQTVRDETRG